MSISLLPVPPSSRVFLFAASLLFLAACDAAVDEGPIPQVRLQQPFADLLAEAGESPGTLDLGDYFQGNESARKLSYTATTDSEAVTATVDGRTLSIAYKAPGNALVVVSAQGISTSLASDTFAVRVTDPAPPGPAAGEADFVPITPGTVWAYDYKYEPKPCNYIRTYREGTLTMTFLSETVTGGVRQVVGEMQVNLTEREFNSFSGQTVTTDVEYTEPFEAEETAKGVRLSGEGLERVATPTTGLWLDRYHPASEERVTTRLHSYHTLVLTQGRPPAVQAVGASCNSYPLVILTPQD